MLILVIVLLAAWVIIHGIQYKSQLQRIHEAGVLTVVSRLGPNTFDMNGERLDGFEYSLIRQFTDYLNVELKILSENDNAGTYRAIDLGIADLAAAGLTLFLNDREAYYFSTPYFEVTTQLIYQGDKPTSLLDYKDKRIQVIAGSAGERYLTQARQDMKDLTWEAISGNSLELFENLESGEADWALMDSIDYEANAVFFPEARVAFDLHDPTAVVWVTKNTGDPSLIEAINTFFASEQQNGELKKLKERYFGTHHQLDFVGMNVINRHMQGRLPIYQKAFKAAAEETGLDWRLLAAIGYQESHWRSRAVSPTGVKGLMMLTLNTARDMGVKNRLNAQQSIRGGAKYFVRMLKTIPERIQEPDRTWLALAAYNIGYGHLEDARKITQSIGRDPDSWLDVKDYLPLLEKPEYYKYTAHGKARGREPVVYVQNIRRYYDILKWNFPEPGEQLEVPDSLTELPEIRVTIPPTL
ncbi:membrane-bound lytic murein transglycosylase MltF [Gynuella sp.]|uniref:membrane-bound lytic murein transglycosylase MltF n=1 Tax=Gynuella sp. TaxID=2969146 RepID=UPI003D145D73